MTTATWLLLLGILLLAMGMTASRIRQLPVTSAMVYLALGIALGPTGFGFFHFNPLKQSALLEIITELAVLISLFAAGVKMPVPVNFRYWQNPLRLAFLSMAITVGLIAVFSWGVLGLPLGAAVLLGAILAPTDPVLATDIQIREPGDDDKLRFSLTCEAGINDGSAFPFVMLGLGLLGLHNLGEYGTRWLIVDVIWATSAAALIGIAGGYLVARLASRVAPTGNGEGLLFDFIGLGLIGTVYGLSLLVNAWGFLAVFVAAVALRQAELKHAPAVISVEPVDELAEDTKAEQCVSQASLVFKEHLERLSEVTLIILVGGTLFVDSWSWPALGLAAFVFFVARPASVYLGLIGSSSTWRQRNLTGWFGVRGVGSIYYLMYAIEHGLPEPVALQLIHFVLVVVALSIIVHGVSVKPMINAFWQKKPLD